MLNRKFSSGFSIIELLIVVAVIGILAAVAIPAYHNHVMRSRQADAYHNLLDIKAAQEMYYSMYNAYAGPYTPLLASDTFSKILSFSYADTTYYAYHITSASGTAFTAMAMGKYRKLAGNNIRIRDDEDPCMVAPGDLKQSLGLPDCP
jgi:type IV pilus assembly protein PilE